MTEDKAKVALLWNDLWVEEAPGLWPLIKTHILNYGFPDGEYTFTLKVRVEGVEDLGD